MDEEFKSCEEAVMRVMGDLAHQIDPKKYPLSMSVSVDWKSRTVRFEPAAYEIDLRLIRDEEDMLEWVEHLCDKSWINGKLLGDFVRAARSHLQWSRARDIA